MLKQSPSRNLRAGRRYKVKHVAQLCLILAVSLWMLYLLRHCYSKKAALEETGVRIMEEKAGGQKVVAKLGRKWLLPGVVDEAEEDEKGFEEERGDEFEQVEDMVEESDEQEMDDKEQVNQRVHHEERD